MADEANELAAHLDSATALLGLRVAPEWRDATLANLAATMKAARFVDAFDVGDETEPAPIYSPAPQGAAT